ncbi:MAG: GNAT family N-acetyltransferase [Pseudomonadota bacterium]
MRNSAITFEPVKRDDVALLREWMDLPHWRQWWGDPETEIADVIAMLNGEDCTRPFLFHLDRTPVGYIQVWSIGPHQNDEWFAKAQWLAHLPSHAVGVDLSVGPADHLGQGLGTRALTLFVEKLRAEGHDTIIIDPDPGNGRAVAAYRKAGFVPLALAPDSMPDVIIMQHLPKNTQVAA